MIDTTLLYADLHVVVASIRLFRHTSRTRTIASSVFYSSDLFTPLILIGRSKQLIQILAFVQYFVILHFLLVHRLQTPNPVTKVRITPCRPFHCICLVQ